LSCRTSLASIIAAQYSAWAAGGHSQFGQKQFFSSFSSLPEYAQSAARTAIVVEARRTAALCHGPEEDPLAKTQKFDFKFLEHEAAGGLCLLAAAAVALVIANSPLAGAYEHLLHAPATLGFAPLALSKSLLHWINDGLMAIFFFLVGLEIKREFLAGALSSRKSAALPVIAALGGMMVPALIYAVINWDNPVALKGWAIPAATDIAFAVAVLAVLGSRIPPALKIFLLALAIIDDLGAIVIIALFYTDNLSIQALLFAALGILGLAALNRSHVTRTWPYIIFGLFVWLCVLKSGVHATLAGVATALAIPLRAGTPEREGPLEKLEHALGPWVSFGVLPLFALANAGVSLKGVTAAQAFDTIPLGIVLGLFFGKPIGIYGFARAAIASGTASMPAGTSAKQLFGAAVLGGIGFTMSLFIGMLAFPDPALATELRIGVLAGSILSAIAGYIVLKRCSPV
jgi:Na+:H+ antiporter, NhaA family